ncbi:MAG: hypothetical protein IKX89_02565 [Firmicutes bacterium]|nr:hypothetical protein [Bacillota bacterium]
MSLQTLISTPFGAMTGMLVVFVIGEFVAKLTKGFIPMALTATFCLIAAFWSGLFPKNIADIAGMSGQLFQVASAFLVINLGTLINRKEMIAQWRTVLICLMGLASIITVCLTIGASLFGFSNAIAAAPPLAGGAIAAAMVREQATAVGNTQALMVAIVCMSLQGVFGYPLVSFCLKKEAQALVQEYREGKLQAPAAAEGAKKTVVKNESTNMVLFKLGVISVCCYLLQYLTTKMGFSISLYVWALVLGFIAHETGLIGDNCLSNANCYGMCITILMLYLMGGLSANDKDTIFSTFAMAACFVLMCAAGMAVMAFIASKIFKKRYWMTWCITLNAYLGFPINVILTNEALELNTEPGDERAAVSSELMPQMLVASFVCVTIVSVIIAGVLVNYLV